MKRWVICPDFKTCLKEVVYDMGCEHKKIHEHDESCTNTVNGCPECIEISKIKEIL